MVTLFDGERAAGLLSGATHLPKQVEPKSVLLTASQILRFTSSGEVDFGGSEYKEAETEPVEPAKRASDDKYGWWDLAGGTYVLVLNEEVAIPQGCVGLLLPSSKITRSGASHAVQVLPDVSEDLRVTLFVPQCGIRIKQNARVSQLIVMGP